MRWWQRNRLWVALIVPALALALAASAFRLVTIQRPNDWSAPIDAGREATLHQSFLGLDDKTHTRTVDVTLNAVTAVPDAGGVAAIDGATLWEIELRLEAAPDQLLAGPCHIMIEGEDGTLYGVDGGKRAAEADGYLPRTVPSCVPAETPGPVIEYTGEFVEAATPRPESWPVTATVSIPTGVRPTHVHVGWDQPEYLRLEVSS